MASTTALATGAGFAGATPFDERDSLIDRLVAASSAPTEQPEVSLDDVDLSLVREVTVTWLEPAVAEGGDDLEMLDTPPIAEGEASEEDGEPIYLTQDGEEIDAERVETFLAGRDAPLAAYADEIVAAGVEHDVDPRVVVGIAIAESNGGERLPSSTHNAWGWSGSGSHGLAAWGSWEESIDAYTERLGALYDTDQVDVEFAQVYCPPNWRWWLDTVTWSMGQI